MITGAGNASKQAGTDLASSLHTPGLRNVLPPIIRAFRREPAIAVTLGYVLVALAGIFYNYSFYRHFDIPILTLSQITDFLAAGLQHPIALLLVLSTFPIIWLFDRFNQRMRRRQAEKRAQLLALPPSPLRNLRLRLILVRPPWLLASSYFLVIFVYSWMFVRVYADYRVEQVLAGDAPLVRVQMSTDAGGMAALEQTPEWTYLGAVSNYVFVYDRGSKRSMILPVNNIVRIEPVPDPRAENAAAKTGENRH